MYQLDDGRVIVDENDQCITCKYYNARPTCPLMEALSVGMAFLDSDYEFTVDNCDMYQERHLRLVKS